MVAKIDASSVCHAKNPDTCRFHGLLRGNVALQQLKEAKDDLQKLEASGKGWEHFGRRSQLELRIAEHQRIYDATDDGYYELRKELNKEKNKTNSNWLNILELNRRVAEAKSTRIKDSQSGRLLNSVPATSEGKKALLEQVITLAHLGNSDSFLDVLDKYGREFDEDSVQNNDETQYWVTTWSGPLGEATDTNNDQRFKEIYNSLIDDLLGEAHGWFDSSQGERWEAELDSLIL